MTFENEINAGVALLDEKRPGWLELVDTDNLMLVSRQWCVLGQVFGYFDDGLKALDMTSDGGFFQVSEEAVAHGFILSEDDMLNRPEGRTFNHLTREWIDKIEELQAA